MIQVIKVYIDCYYFQEQVDLAKSRFDVKDDYEGQGHAHCSKLQQKSSLDPQLSLTLQREDTHNLEKEVQFSSSIKIIIMHDASLLQLYNYYYTGGYSCIARIIIRCI